MNAASEGAMPTSWTMVAGAAPPLTAASVTPSSLSPDGGFALRLGSSPPAVPTRGIYQTVTGATSGASYTLTFYEYLSPAQLCTFSGCLFGTRLLINGTLANFTSRSPVQSGWMQRTIAFTAPAVSFDLEVVQYSNDGPVIIYLDGLSLACTPAATGTCAMDSDCNDNNPCTAGRCTVSGSVTVPNASFNTASPSNWTGCLPSGLGPSFTCPAPSSWPALTPETPASIGWPVSPNGGNLLRFASAQSGTSAGAQTTLSTTAGASYTITFYHSISNFQAGQTTATLRASAIDSATGLPTGTPTTWSLTDPGGSGFSSWIQRSFTFTASASSISTILRLETIVNTNGTGGSPRNAIDGFASVSGGTCTYTGGSGPGCCLSNADCVDSDVCTANTCNLSTNACSTTADPTAPGGGCTTGCCNANADCNDGNVCTTESCNTSTHCCTRATTANCCTPSTPCPAPGSTCQTNTCSSTSDAAAGTCSPSTIAGCCAVDTDCNDSNACTTNTCSPGGSNLIANGTFTTYDAMTGMFPAPWVQPFNSGGAANAPWFPSPPAAKIYDYLEQTFTTVAGRTYRLTLLSSAPYPGMSVIVTAGPAGTGTGDLNATFSGPEFQIASQSVNFTASTTSTRMRFTSSQAPGDPVGLGNAMVIDDVVVLAPAACTYPTMTCSDGLVCTTDTCNPASGCAFPAVVPAAPAAGGCCTAAGQCNDGNSCNTDSCTGNVCVYSAPTAASCTTAADCADDGNACTIEACNNPMGTNMGGCCTRTNAAMGFVCRAAIAGGCDTAETCAGGGVACPADVRSAANAITAGCVDTDSNTCTTAACNGSGVCNQNQILPTTVCRAAANSCDNAESCSGGACPADTFVAANTVNAGCVDSDSNTCTQAACNGSGSCNQNQIFTTNVCRVASAGGCDVAETCTGASSVCPGNGYQPNTFTCRTSAGGCDIAETCSGSSDTCPGDTLRAAAFICRASVDLCDVDETCNGSTSACPADAVRPNSFTCRVSGGVCDVAENCNGVATTCPADGFLNNTNVCRVATAGGCDVAENCTGSAAACPVDGFSSAITVCRVATANGCDVAETCPGTNANCPANAFASAGVSCRVAAAGGCDVAETCPGGTDVCPANVFTAGGTTCRGSAGDCDVVETCSGSTAACPADGFLGIGASCRAAVAGGCDVAETCTGTAACPADGFVAANTACSDTDGSVCTTAGCDGSGACNQNQTYTTAVCRAAVVGSLCDAAESCTGASSVCPADGVLASGASCRPSTAACDPAETCNGSSASCPADTTSCTPCTGQPVGAQVAGCNSASDSDGNSCTDPACDGMGACRQWQIVTAGVCRTATGACDTSEACVANPNQVETLAGSSSGFTNATGTLAQFNSPGGVVLDPTNSVLYIADTANHRIRQVLIATGVVTTVAGNGAAALTDNGTGTSASFSSPSGLAIDTAGNLYVADTGNNRIRKIAAGGTRAVTTLCTTVGSTYGVAVNGAGSTAYFTETGASNRVRSCAVATSVATILAGTAGASFVDNTGTTAQFNGPRGLALNAAETQLYIADTGNHAIRRLVISTTVVTTYAGATAVASAGTSGNTDATGNAARFSSPNGIFRSAGDYYVADTGNHRIRRIDSSVVVTTYAGTNSGTSNGSVSVAQFASPVGVAVVNGGLYQGTILVGDTGNHRIRTVRVDGGICPTDAFVAANSTPVGCAAANDTDLNVCTTPACNGSGGCNQGQAFTTSVCRVAAAGGCDVAESCTGASATCPVDAFLSAATVCRAQTANGCDVAENCTGSSAACPANGFVGMGVSCRAATANGCDVAEVCPGTNDTCPVNGFLSAGTSCRASAGACDVVESCSGSTDTCPVDSFAVSGTVCRADSGNGCDIAETCSGASSACPANSYRLSGFTCRADSGNGCDMAETCAGGTDVCPANSFRAAAFVCRVAAAGGCDIQEVCAGGTDTCPANSFSAANAITAGCVDGDGNACTTAACNGSGTCTQSQITNGGTTCRVAAGSCDLPEVCAGAVCPADAFSPMATVCRAATGGGCDPAESCSGSTASCPADVTSGSCPPGACLVNGDCDDSNSCTTNTCVSGACVYAQTAACCNNITPCDDANICTTESCSSATAVAGTCSTTAIPSCCSTTTGTDCRETPTDDQCTTDSCSYTGAGLVANGSMTMGADSTSPPTSWTVQGDNLVGTGSASTALGFGITTQVTSASADGGRFSYVRGCAAGTGVGCPSGESGVRQTLTGLTSGVNYLVTLRYFVTSNAGANWYVKVYSGASLIRHYQPGSIPVGWQSLTVDIVAGATTMDLRLVGNARVDAAAIAIDGVSAVSAGSCSRSTVAACCNTAHACTSDSLFCTTDTCSVSDLSAGSCTYPATAGCCDFNSDCRESPDNVCSVDTCNTSTHVCSRSWTAGCCNSGRACPGVCDACSSSSVSVAGICGVAGGCCTTAADCNDGFDCTADTCVANSCQNATIAGCCSTTNDPSVLILLDRSCSMDNASPTTSKWYVAVRAVLNMLNIPISDPTSPLARVRWALSFFPDLEADAPGCPLAPAPVVPFASNNASTVYNLLAEAQQNTGAAQYGDRWFPGAPTCQTPIDWATYHATQLAELADASRFRYVILIGDGAQNAAGCGGGGGDAASRTRIAALKAQGVRTYVVGYQASIGTEVDALNDFAVAGGTALYPPTSDGVTSNQYRYYFADTAAGLTSDLVDIANRLVPPTVTCTETPTDDVCTTNTCNAGTNTCDPPAAISGCCANDAGCNDGNACTTDTCNLTTHVCNAPAVILGCGCVVPAGVPQNGTMDGGTSTNSPTGWAATPRLDGTGFCAMGNTANNAGAVNGVVANFAPAAAGASSFMHITVGTSNCPGTVTTQQLLNGLTPGAVYQVDFRYRNTTFFPSTLSTPTLTVRMNTANLRVFQDSPSAWTSGSVSFTAPASGTGTLAFIATGGDSLGQGAFALDNVIMSCETSCTLDSQCTDAEVCTSDVCVNGQCASSYLSTCCNVNSECMDANGCTNDQCVSNVCTHTNISNCCNYDVDCNDSQGCTLDTCDTSTNTCCYNINPNDPSFLCHAPTGAGSNSELCYNATTGQRGDCNGICWDNRNESPISCNVNGQGMMSNPSVQGSNVVSTGCGTGGITLTGSGGSAPAVDSDGDCVPDTFDDCPGPGFTPAP